MECCRELEACPAERAGIWIAGHFSLRAGMLAGHAMTFPVTPPQFFNLTKNLCNVPGVQVRMSNLLSGSISNSDVTLSYAYDGMAVLTVDVTAKHSFKAKLASDSEIQQKIQALLTANSRGF